MELIEKGLNAMGPNAIALMRFQLEMLLAH